MQEFFQKKFKILKKFVFFQKNLKKFMKKQEKRLTNAKTYATIINCIIIAISVRREVASDYEAQFFYLLLQKVALGFAVPKRRITTLKMEWLY